MDSELLLKIIGYFPDYLSALSRMLLRFFGQPLSKQLYALSHDVKPLADINPKMIRCEAFFQFKFKTFWIVNY